MARTFSPAEYIGSLEASIRTPESAAPVLGAALVSSGSLDQLGWTSGPVALDANVVHKTGDTMTGPLNFVVNQHHKSGSDNANRFLFEGSGATYYAAPTKHVFRQGAGADLGQVQASKFELPQTAYLGTTTLESTAYGMRLQISAAHRMEFTPQETGYYYLNEARPRWSFLDYQVNTIGHALVFSNSGVDTRLNGDYSGNLNVRGGTGALSGINVGSAYISGNAVLGDGTNFYSMTLNTAGSNNLTVGWGGGGNFGLDSTGQLGLRSVSNAQLLSNDGQVRLDAKYGVFVRDHLGNAGPLSAGAITASSIDFGDASNPTLSVDPTTKDLRLSVYSTHGMRVNSQAMSVNTPIDGAIAGNFMAAAPTFNALVARAITGQTAKVFEVRSPLGATAASFAADGSLHTYGQITGATITATANMSVAGSLSVAGLLQSTSGGASFGSPWSGAANFEFYTHNARPTVRITSSSSDFDALQVTRGGAVVSAISNHGNITLANSGSYDANPLLKLKLGVGQYKATQWLSSDNSELAFMLNTGKLTTKGYELGSNNVSVVSGMYLSPDNNTLRLAAWGGFRVEYQNGTVVPLAMDHLGNLSVTGQIAAASHIISGSGTGNSTIVQHVDSSGYADWNGNANNVGKTTVRTVAAGTGVFQVYLNQGSGLAPVLDIANNGTATFRGKVTLPWGHFDTPGSNYFRMFSSNPINIQSNVNSGNAVVLMNGGYESFMVMSGGGMLAENPASHSTVPTLQIRPRGTQLAPYLRMPTDGLVTGNAIEVTNYGNVLASISKSGAITAASDIVGSGNLSIASGGSQFTVSGSTLAVQGTYPTLNMVGNGVNTIIGSYNGNAYQRASVFTWQDLSATYQYLSVDQYQVESRSDNGIHVKSLGGGNGHITVRPGAGTTGYIEWIKTDGTRSSYMGYDSDNDLTLSLAGKLKIIGGLSATGDIAQGASGNHHMGYGRAVSWGTTGASYNGNCGIIGTSDNGMLVTAPGGMSVSGNATFTNNVAAVSFSASGNINLSGSTDLATVQNIIPSNYNGRARYYAGGNYGVFYGSTGPYGGSDNSNYAHIQTHGGFTIYSTQASTAMLIGEAYPTPIVASIVPFIAKSNIEQGYNSLTSSFRSVMVASGQRKTQVGNGLGTWQDGYREEYNAGGYRCSIYGKTPVGQFTAPAVATDLASAITSVNTHTVSLTSFGLYA